MHRDARGLAISTASAMVPGTDAADLRQRLPGHRRRRHHESAIASDVRFGSGYSPPNIRYAPTSTRSTATRASERRSWITATCLARYR